jgi:methylated-DNA-[protein]-cysteine S-methyltransferase
MHWLIQETTTLHEGWNMQDGWSYLLLDSKFGTVGIVWKARPVVVERIYLPAEADAITKRVKADYPLAYEGGSLPVADLASQIGRLLAGESLSVSIDLLALDQCTPFQRSVLLAEYGIPRGWVSTYGRLARHLGDAGAARAVGSALAHNPFPLAIPCHRAIQSDGSLGGFQGGVAMKRALLSMEGLEFDVLGRVKMIRVHY